VRHLRLSLQDQGRWPGSRGQGGHEGRLPVGQPRASTPWYRARSGPLAMDIPLPERAERTGWWGAS
jgi:hypothetical protein